MLGMTVLRVTSEREDRLVDSGSTFHKGLNSTGMTLNRKSSTVRQSDCSMQLAISEEQLAGKIQVHGKKVGRKNLKFRRAVSRINMIKKIER